MFEELVAFLRTQENFFIEAEAKLNRIQRFIDNYNELRGENVNIDSDGIIVLENDANKWGLELRLYVVDRPPHFSELGFENNHYYRPEYSYRLNSRDVINRLFEAGFRIGANGERHE